MLYNSGLREELVHGDGMWSCVGDLKEKCNLLEHAYAVSENFYWFMSSTLIYSSLDKHYS